MHDDSPVVETPGLDAYMAGERPPRPIGPAELAELLRGARDPSVDDPDLRPHLVLTVWRLARAAGSALGCLAEDERLEDALDGLRPDPWTDRIPARPTPSQRPLVRLDASSALLRLVTAGGFPILPPADRAAAERWADALGLVAMDLALVRAPRGPDCLRILGDPETLRTVGISRRAVLDLEELLVDQARRVLVRHGEAAVIDHLVERHGLSRRECHGLICLARADALRHGRSSVEDDRALMTAMLKDALARARATLSLDAEVKIMRELARVQGLTRSEPEDRGAELTELVGRVAARRDARLLPPEAADALETPDAMLALPPSAAREVDLLEEFDAAEPVRE